MKKSSVLVLFEMWRARRVTHLLILSHQQDMLLDLVILLKRYLTCYLRNIITDIINRSISRQTYMRCYYILHVQ
jgi:hypothetical protein